MFVPRVVPIVLGGIAIYAGCAAHSRDLPASVTPQTALPSDDAAPLERDAAAVALADAVAAPPAEDAALTSTDASDAPSASRHAGLRNPLAPADVNLEGLRDELRAAALSCQRWAFKFRVSGGGASEGFTSLSVGFYPSPSVTRTLLDDVAQQLGPNARPLRRGESRGVEGARVYSFVGPESDPFPHKEYALTTATITGRYFLRIETSLPSNASRATIERYLRIARDVGFGVGPLAKPCADDPPPGP